MLCRLILWIVWEFESEPLRIARYIQRHCYFASGVFGMFRGAHRVVLGVKLLLSSVQAVDL